MAFCKHCGNEDLGWLNQGTQTEPKWKLQEKDGSIHQCMKDGKTTRLSGIFTMLKGMTYKELGQVIATAARELTLRVEDAITEGDPVTQPAASLKPGPKGPEPMDEALPF
jgi:hypothetical protein